MKKLYNTPIINITAYSTIDTTNIGFNSSAPITQKYKGTGEIDKDTFKLNDLNS